MQIDASITVEKVLNERQKLYTVLQFDSSHTKIFKIGERICINQARGVLFDIINYFNDVIEVEQVRVYKIPERVQEKIDWACELIERTKFQSYPDNWYLEINENSYESRINKL
ncbi:hypothetical protein [Flavobacterium sp. N1994]|uniref:hypothetical protein n=1 Tax=Flavobacterium sp. N1994 TaxID=2986827 RepID=UPI0022225A00|nr:hypothetical protein [Flavobacterium sp. N1994]